MLTKRVICFSWCLVLVVGFSPYSQLVAQDEPVQVLWPADPPAPIQLAQLPQAVPVNGQLKLAPGAQPAQDAIDARAPVDRRTAGFLQRAQSQLDAGNVAGAIDLIRGVIDRPATIVRHKTGEYRLSVDEANRLLNRLSVPEKKEYETRFGALSQKLMEDALKADDQTALFEVASKYFHTKAGFKAANLLATLHMDRGEYVSANHWMNRLVAASSMLTYSMEWKLRHELVKHALDSSRKPNVPEKVVLRGKTISGPEWLKENALPGVSTNQKPLRNWTQLRGTASRHALADGGDPLLLQRWSIPLANSEPVRQKLDMLTAAIDAANRAAIPVGFPVAVNGRLMFRSLHGVVVVDAKTGAVQWESRDRNAASHLLSDARSRYSAQQNPVGSASGLGGLLYRDGVWGLISCDAQRVYVLEDHVVGAPRTSPYSRRTNRNNLRMRTNRLAAYNLALGHVSWEVGGQKMNEPFDLPLAGHLFLGPPMIENGLAWVVAEYDGEVRLCVIDTETGEPQWSVLLAIPEASIDRDTIRRNWPAQVASRDGIVVCPTTLGWLVAVDKTSHSILWMRRTTSRVQNAPPMRNGRIAVTPTLKLNDRWVPSAPIIADGSVIFSPPESPELHCLRLTDGKPVWTKPKTSTQLYVAGVRNKTVFVVNTTSVDGYSLQDGKLAWSVPLDSIPTGQGVLTKSRLYVPVNGSRVVAVGIAEQKIVETFQTDRSRVRIGNLIMHQGQVFSLSGSQLIAFEQKETFRQQLAESRQETNATPFSLLQGARVALAENDVKRALADLGRVQLDTLPAQQQQTHRSLEKVALARALKQADVQAAPGLITRLEALAENPTDRINVKRVEFERSWNARNYRAAAETLFELFQNFADMLLQNELSNTVVSVSLDAWLAARFKRLHRQADPETVAFINQRIQSLLSGLSADDSKNEWRFLEIFGAYSAVTPRLLDVAGRTVDDFALANQLLKKLARSQDPDVAGPAALSLATLLQRVEFRDEARNWFQKCVADFGSVNLPGATTIGDAAQKSLTDLRMSAAPDRSWTAPKWEWQRLGPDSYSSRSATSDLIYGRFNNSLTRRFRIEFDQGAGRVNVLEAQSGDVYWSVPFPRTSATVIPVEFSGQQLIIAAANTIKCLSIMDRRVLWSHKFDDSATSAGINFGWQTGAGIRSGSHVVYSGQRLNDLAAQKGMLAVVTPNYVCVRRRRLVRVFDAFTGKLRWEMRAPGASSRIFGTDAAVMIEGESGCQAFDPVDGSALEITAKPPFASKAVAAHHRGLVMIEAKSFFFGLGHSTTLRLFDPIAGSDVWSKTSKSQQTMCLANQNTMVNVGFEGELTLIDLATGAERSFPGIVDKKSVATLKSLGAFIDGDRLFLMVTTKTRQAYLSAQFPQMYVSGTIVCVDRRSGEKLWSREAIDHMVVKEHLQHSPGLVLYGQKQIRINGASKRQQTLTAIDKHTGEPLATHQSVSLSTLLAAQVNRIDGYFEVKTYDRRMRLVPVK